jgi:DNA-binding NtrC family response regulator
MNTPAPLHVRKVLLVEDDDDCRFAVQTFLSSSGYVVDPVSNAKEALQVFDPKIHAAVLTDNSMPGMTGLEMAQIIKIQSPSTPVIMHTGHLPRECSYVNFVIHKPAPLLEIKEALDHFLGELPSST